MAPKARAAKAAPGRQVVGGPRQRSKVAARPAGSGFAAPTGKAAPAPPPPLPLQRQISAGIIDCFRRLDQTGDGKIPRDSLAQVLDKLAPGRFDMTPLLDAIDKNGDGIIDYVEFTEWIFDGHDDAIAVRGLASAAESPQEQFERCKQELAECEEAITPKPVDVWFEQDDNPGIRYGKGEERRANVVMRVQQDGAAHKAGVRPGWRVTKVADRAVTGINYVPDLIMEGQRVGAVLVMFLRAEDLDRQRAAEVRLPEILAALDVAEKRRDAAAKPLEEAIGELQAQAVAEPSSLNVVAREEEAKPTDALGALAKYHADNSTSAHAPSYEELQAAMGRESWTKWRFGMSPQEWFEMMGVADVRQDDPYKVLGVEPDATQEQIKNAFRELAREYHPDKFPDDPGTAEARFHRIKQAYERVRSEDVRAKTDSQLGVTDFFSLYMSESREGQQRMMRQMNLAILDDPDALPKEAGMDDALRDAGNAVVKYYHYALPFPVEDGRLSVASIDAIYSLREMFPGCTLLLAEWRSNDNHILRPGDTDTGESPLLIREGAFFCGAKAGMTYHLIVQEKDDGR